MEGAGGAALGAEGPRGGAGGQLAPSVPGPETATVPLEVSDEMWQARLPPRCMFAWMRACLRALLPRFACLRGCVVASRRRAPLLAFLSFVFSCLLVALSGVLDIIFFILILSLSS